MFIKQQIFFKFTVVMGLICSVHIWGLHYNIGNSFYDVIDSLFYVIVLISLTQFIFLKRNNFAQDRYFLFNNEIISLYFFLFISTLSSWYYHDQFPFLTALAMRFFAFFLLYYILVIANISKDIIIRFIITFACIYMVIFSLQLLIFPTAIVPLGNTTEFDRGFLRLRLEGVGFVTLAGFYFLNKYLVERNLLPLVAYFVCFIFVFILGFRTLMLTYIFSSLLLIVLVNKKFTNVLYMTIPIFFLLILVFQIDFFSDFINESIYTTVDQFNDGENYIRFLTFDFLFKNVNENWITIILGNGQPFVGTSYGNYVGIYGAKVMGFIAADLGLLGFVFNYGLITCFIFLYIFIKGIRTKIEVDSFYIKAFFIYLIISSFTTAEIYRAGMFGPICVALYLINISYLAVLKKRGVKNI